MSQGETTFHAMAMSMGEQVAGGNIMEGRYTALLDSEIVQETSPGEMSLEDIAGKTLPVETTCRAMATFQGETSHQLLADIAGRGECYWYNY